MLRAALFSATETGEPDFDSPLCTEALVGAGGVAAGAAGAVAPPVVGCCCCFVVESVSAGTGIVLVASVYYAFSRRLENEKSLRIDVETKNYCACRSGSDLVAGVLVVGMDGDGEQVVASFGLLDIVRRRAGSMMC